MIISSHFITIDGVIGAPERWHAEFASAEQYDLLRAQLARVDGLLIGRRTYDEFAAYWPQQGDDVPIALETNAARKYVVSSNPDLSWGPAELLGDDPIAVAHDLAQRGTDVWCTGGRLARTLLGAGLVDELQFLLDPIVLGAGMRLFSAERWQSQYRLISLAELPHGVAHLIYRSDQK